MLAQYADRWALVTGASSGIGAEFARQLAARGMHLVVTARRKPRLEDLAAELDRKHGARCHVIACDLSEPEAPRRLLEQVDALGIELELLINNAATGFVGTVDETDPERMQAMIRLNVAAVTALTYGVLPGMLERGHGGIINVASLSALQPVAYMPVYSATKAYVLHFTEALWAEVHERGVQMMAFCPGTTATEFFEVAGVPNWLKKHRSQTPRQVVRAGLKAFDKGRHYVIPGWRNFLISLGSRVARRRMVVLQSKRFFRPTPKKPKPTPDDQPQQTDA